MTTREQSLLNKLCDAALELDNDHQLRLDWDRTRQHVFILHVSKRLGDGSRVLLSHTLSRVQAELNYQDLVGATVDEMRRAVLSFTERLSLRLSRPC